MLKITVLALAAMTILVLSSPAQNSLTPAAIKVTAPAPAVLPGKGVAQHPFLYAGEWDTRKPEEQSIFIVRGG